MDSLLVPIAVVSLFLLGWFARSRGESAALRLDPRTASVEELLLAGRKIEAIKLYRRQHGAGLKEAKEAVEALLPGLPRL